MKTSWPAAEPPRLATSKMRSEARAVSMKVSELFDPNGRIDYTYDKVTKCFRTEPLPQPLALVAALGADPILLALPAAFAATWGFMLPAGTGPNALAWATGHCSMWSMIKAGFALDIAGMFLLTGVVWGIAAMT